VTKQHFIFPNDTVITVLPYQVKGKNCQISFTLLKLVSKENETK